VAEWTPVVTALLRAKYDVREPLDDAAFLALFAPT
jgi:hypothetical protein